jgi:hypothetical protein
MLSFRRKQMPPNIFFSVTPRRLASTAHSRSASFCFSSGVTFRHLAMANVLFSGALERVRWN